jgi:CPA2 family monovalent cation:H+ antiporter-2
VADGIQVEIDHCDRAALFAVWRIAVPGAFIQSTISTGVLAVILHLLGWSWTSGIILGMAISVASTVVMALVLGEHRDLHGIVGHIAIGWTVVEDLLTIAMLLLLPIIFGESEAAGQGVLLSLGVAVLRLAGMIVTIVVLGLWVIPWLLERVAKTHARELFTLTVLVLAVGIAVGSAELFGVSVALGAFVAGLAVGARSSQRGRLPTRCPCAMPSRCSSSSRWECSSIPEVSSKLPGSSWRCSSWS